MSQTTQAYTPQIQSHNENDSNHTQNCRIIIILALEKAKTYRKCTTVHCALYCCSKNYYAEIQYYENAVIVCFIVGKAGYTVYL